MSDDFITRLGVQLRDAAEREAHASPLRRRLVALPSLAPVGAAAALVLVIAIGVLAAGAWLRGDEPAQEAPPRVIASFALTDGPASIAGGFGSAWFASADAGAVLRVDPRTRKVVARIPARGPIVNIGAGSVWALELQGERLLRIDPATNEVTAAIRAPAPASDGPADVQTDGGEVWVVTLDGAVRIDTERNRAGRRIPFAGATADPRWIALGGGSLWVLARDDRLIRLDPRTGETTAVIPVRLPQAEFVLPTPDGLFLGTGTGRLARVDPASGRLLWQRTLGTRAWVTPAFGALWASSSSPARPRDRLAELDPATGGTLTSVELPELTTEWIAPVGDELWLSTTSGKAMVVRP